MQWNEIDYETQNRVLARIAALVRAEKDSSVRIALAAALNELDLWGNRPDIPDIDPPPMTEFNQAGPSLCESVIVQADIPYDIER